MENTVSSEWLEAAQEVLRMYGFSEPFELHKVYLHETGRDDYFKLIFAVDLADGMRLVVKILHEDRDHLEERKKTENQSRFSEFIRLNGIKTPKRYAAGGRFCNELLWRNKRFNVTVEDWCGEEIMEITVEIARRIGGLMAQMHSLSTEAGFTIGSGTLFSAAYWNDVDAYDRFCEITGDARLNQEAVAQIKSQREEKLAGLRKVWETLPKAAVQGDISINNLVNGDDGLIVFDYNNAGDEVLVSDLVLEGLLTAFEMDLPAGETESYREQLFPALLEGYLSVRTLNEAECAAAWDIYTLYHGLWFTRIVYNEDSLEKTVGRGEYEAANRLLKRMLDDITERDDGRFRGIGG